MLCCIMSSSASSAIQHCNLVVSDARSPRHRFVAHSDILGKSCGSPAKVISPKEHRRHSVCVEFSRGIGSEGQTRCASKHEGVCDKYTTGRSESNQPRSEALQMIGMLARHLLHIVA